MSIVRAKFQPLRLPPASVLVWLALAWASVPALAADDAASWRRCDGWEVTSFAVPGVPADLQRDLAAGLQYAGRRKLMRGLVRPPFKATALADDVRRVRLFLAARGYPASTVAVTLAPDAKARRVGVVLAVDPGPAVLVAEVVLEGWPDEVPMPAVDDSALPAAGVRFSDAAVGKGRVHLVRLLQDAGYAQARVEPATMLAGGAAVRLVYRVAAGEPYVITSVDARGSSPDLLPLARRIIAMEPGTRFSTTRIDDAAADLRTTQLFSLVEVATEPIGPGSLALDARLADARVREWSASVGSWTDNPWMANLAWTHRNLFREGRGLRAGGTYATHNQRVGAEVFKLGWLSPRAVTRLAGQWLREDEDAYRSTEIAATLSQSFHPRGRGLWQLGASISRVDVVSFAPDLEDLPEAQEWLLELWVDRKWDWTDDLLYPTRGGSLMLSTTWAPQAGPLGASYVQASAEAKGLLGLDGFGVGAARLWGGWSRPLGGNDDLLANRRFHAGGYNSMRGYARRRLGPTDADGNPRGGQALLVAGAEWRRRIVWILDAALFLDAGNVWRTPGDVRLAELETAWGIDMDVRTPLGPLRVGHAWVLGTPLAGEPAELWHFGIGYPW